jgi:L-ribulose-5-phosphate 4-epimerase
MRSVAFEEIKASVWQANRGLVEAGLIVLTWGNASGIDRSAGVVAIKPSGVPYNELRPEHIVVVSLDTGKVVEGTGRPSSDCPTHLELYRCFEKVGGIVHTHSTHATAFAQAQREIPCLGTTHADAFYGCVPLTRAMTAQEIQGAYELNTGKVIVECFQQRTLDPIHFPGVLVCSHGPFAWGDSPEKALENAITLEAIAQMALETYMLNPGIGSVPQALLDKHFLRKHGPGAYYGQK